MLIFDIKYVSRQFENLPCKVDFISHEKYNQITLCNLQVQNYSIKKNE